MKYNKTNLIFDVYSERTPLLARADAPSAPTTAPRPCRAWATLSAAPWPAPWTGPIWPVRHPSPAHLLLRRPRRQPPRSRRKTCAPSADGGSPCLAMSIPKTTGRSTSASASPATVPRLSPSPPPAKPNTRTSDNRHHPCHARRRQLHACCHSRRLRRTASVKMASWPNARFAWRSMRWASPSPGSIASASSTSRALWTGSSGRWSAPCTKLRGCCVEICCWSCC